MYSLITNKNTRDTSSYEHMYNQQEVISFLRSELLKQNDIFFFSTIRNINNYLIDRCVLPQFDISQLSYKNRVFNHTNFSKDMESGKIKFLVFRSNEFPEKILGVDLCNFKLYKHIQGCDVYINLPGT